MGPKKCTFCGKELRYKDGIFCKTDLECKKVRALETIADRLLSIECILENIYNTLEK